MKEQRLPPLVMALLFTGAALVQGQEFTASPRTRTPQESPVVRDGTQEKVTRGGEVVAPGNPKSPNRLLRQRLNSHDGKVLDDKARQAVDKRLSDARPFVGDPQEGIRPTVTVVESNRKSYFKDILGQAPEDQKKPQQYFLRFEGSAGIH